MLKEKEGSITIFLSLILLLILAVTMTTVETARMDGARIHTERALQTAMDSVLAEYYKPLFQEYHLFGLDGSYGTGNINFEAISKKLNNYMEYTFNPGKELKDTWGNSYGYFNIYGINTESIRVSQTDTLMDFDGELFINQALSYMKYKEIGNGIEKFLPKLSEVRETGNAQAVLVEKQDTEKSFYKIDLKILDLMQLIDGITINEKGVKLNSNSTISVQNNFVKKIYTLPVTRANLGIDNDLVYNSLIKYYKDPYKMIDLAMEEINSLYENASKKEAAGTNYKRLKAIDQNSIKSPEELTSLRLSISNTKDKLNKYKMREKQLIKSLNAHMKELNRLVEGTLPAIQKALKVIDGLILLQKEASQDLENYESFLLEEKNSLSEELYNNLLEDLIQMQKYKGENENKAGLTNQYDFEGMKNTLNTNENVLSLLKTDTHLTVTEAKESWTGIETALFRIRNNLKTYSYDKLKFDYSTLEKPIDSDSFFVGLKSVLEDGILSLIKEDMDQISNKKLSSRDLPTKEHKIQSDGDTKNFLSTITDINLIGGGDLFSVVTDAFDKEINFKETEYNGIDETGKFLLLQEYLMEHFRSYNEENILDEVNALDYELEYILMGKDNDLDNLKTVLMRILLFRTAMNMITLLSDKNSNEKARVLAAGFVGFTGLPALVEITKMIILTVWAFAEALVDVAALLQNKSLPLLKKGNIQIDLYEIFHLSKALIKSKADRIKDNKNLTALNYQDYLKLFLYMERQTDKSFRAMDLIQENLQLNYEDTFYIRNCIFGFGAEADFKMQTKFINFPFIKKMVNNQDYAFAYHVSLEYSY